MTYVLYSLQFAMMLLRGLTKRKFATMDEGDRDNARAILDSLVMAANQALADLDAAPLPTKAAKLAAGRASLTKAGSKANNKSGHPQPGQMDFSSLDHMLLWHIISQNEINLYLAERADQFNSDALALLNEIRVQGDQRTADSDLAEAARIAKPVIDGLTAQLSLATPDSQ